MIRAPIVEFIIKNQEALIQVDLLKELWMIPERISASDHSQEGTNLLFTISCLSNLYKGKLFTWKGYFYSVIEYQRIDNRGTEVKTFRVKADPTNIVYVPGETKALCTPQDTFILNPGDIVNYKGSSSVGTTIGRFVANYIFLVYPFADTIEYLNEEFTASKLEKRISIPLLEGKISVASVKDRYVNSLSLLGQSTEIICPGISEKTIVIPKEITDLRERLVEENREALESGDASVMSDIEHQLIKAYKEHLKGDPSLHFLLKSKYFNVTLKKLFLTQGMTEVFGSPGKFEFIDNPMGNGWKQKDLPTIFNEVRAGSYARGIETQDGGVIAKLILRVLQDTRITIDDCKTRRGELIHGDRDVLKDFLWNYIIEDNGSNTLITEGSIDDLIGKELVIRTPGYCQAEQGFCAKCFGKLFEDLGQKAFAPVANGFSQAITVSRLKSMHGRSHQTTDISDLNKYLVGV